jgi:hypothetical protein
MPDGEQEGGDGMSAENNWTWPPSMDAVVAAPESHRVLFENDDVRVLEVTIHADILVARGHRVGRDAGELDGLRGSTFGRERR